VVGKGVIRVYFPKKQLKIVVVFWLWPYPRAASLKKEKLEGAPGSNLMFLCTKILKRELPP